MYSFSKEKEGEKGGGQFWLMTHGVVGSTAHVRVDIWKGGQKRGTWRHKDRILDARMEWREVRRKGKPAEKQPTKSFDDPSVTSFYVNNLPGDTFRKELWAPCAAIGKLVDIYIAGRKDASGSFFAFIRYENPSNPEEVVQRLNEVNCRGRKLTANIAKRKRPTIRRQIPPPVHKPRPIFNAARRDVRSFADVANGKMPANPPLEANEVSDIKKWLDKSALVGEVKNFDSLCNFPELFEMEGYEVSEIKYGGGLNIILKFKSGRSSEIFRANKSIWMKWFSRVDFMEAKTWNFERIAWLKIVGVPFQAWDEANFMAITSKFGRSLLNISSFWNSRDVSNSKFCILTSSRRKINEELSLMLNGNEYKIGCFEIEDGWAPFSPATFPDSETEEEEDKGEDDDDDGISDTYRNDEMEVEEGEFFPDADEPAGAAGEDETLGDQSGTLHGEHQSVGKKGCACNLAINSEQLPKNMIRNVTAPIPQESSSTSECTVNNFSNKPNPNRTDFSKNGPALLTPPSGPTSSPDFEKGDTELKRRRTKLKSKYPSRLPSSTIHHSPLRSLDLNHRPSNTDNSSHGGNISGPQVRTSPSTSSSELRHTINLGNQVGFQLGSNDGAILDAVSGAGVKTTVP
ncbi:hypothetical protein LXL04_026392 [Taraxacum kok-saghyz]